MAKRPLRPAPPPLEANDVAVVTGGTVIWFVLFLVQLPFYGWFADRGHEWWVWTPLAGTGVGLFGYWYISRRNAAIRAAKEAAAAEGGTVAEQGSTPVDGGAAADDRGR